VPFRVRKNKNFSESLFFSSSSSLSKRTTRDAFEQQQRRHKQKRKKERERDLFFPFTQVKMRFWARCVFAPAYTKKPF
jgi:hypothetical protein